MKVKHLIERLRKLNPEADVDVEADCRYYAGEHLIYERGRPELVRVVIEAVEYEHDGYEDRITE